MRAGASASLALLVSLLLTSPSPAQDKKAPANPVLAVLELDTNGDSVLDSDEIPEDGQAAFKRLLQFGDQNKNGKLEADEMRALAQKVRSVAGAGAARFKAMDKDGDGKLSKEEFQGPKVLFPQVDADHDGFISQQEAGRFAAIQSVIAKKRFAAMDKDGDGKVSREEFNGPTPRFAQLDTDGDGFISKDEVDAIPVPPGSPAARPGAKEPTTGEPAEKAKPGVGLPRRRIRAMDTDGDGKVSRAEFTGTPRMFDRLDTNHDGQLSVDDVFDRIPRPKTEPKSATKPKA